MRRRVGGLAGSRFGMLTVVSELRSAARGCTWNCICDCGRSTTARGNELTSGHKRSCGCLKRPDLSALVGETFGRLTVLRCVGSIKKKRALECICSCGVVCVAVAYQLTSGHQKSCGCLTRPDLTGTTFNEWLVLGPVKDRAGGRVWECVCSCGTVGHVTTDRLRSGHSKSCGWSHRSAADKRQATRIATQKYRSTDYGRLKARLRLKTDPARRGARQTYERYRAANLETIRAKGRARYWADPDKYRAASLASWHNRKSHISDAQWSEILSTKAPKKRAA